ncbi:type IV pilus modification PilV family protein [Helicobacter rodentium]|uniref:type IV pilus modification PilV family protein n=1 Tax=Helicobacter rodentium TaxID=59617 RepID=UPI0025A53C54|nr:hypothetical protein [Helicobacter rodentium]
MGFLNNLKLQTKLVCAIGVIFIVGILVLSVIITQQVSENMQANARTIIARVAQSDAERIRGMMNELGTITQGSAKTLDYIFESTNIQNLNAQDVYSVMEGFFDSSSFADYGFLYIKDTPAHFKTNPLNVTQEDELCYCFMIQTRKISVV